MSAPARSAVPPAPSNMAFSHAPSASSSAPPLGGAQAAAQAAGEIFPLQQKKKPKSSSGICNTCSTLYSFYWGARHRTGLQRLCVLLFIAIVAFPILGHYDVWKFGTAQDFIVEHAGPALEGLIIGLSFIYITGYFHKKDAEDASDQINGRGRYAKPPILYYPTQAERFKSVPTNEETIVSVNAGIVIPNEEDAGYFLT